MHLRGKLQFAQFMQILILVPTTVLGIIVAIVVAEDWGVALLAAVMLFGLIWTLSPEIGQKVFLADDVLIYRPPGFQIFGRFGWRDAVRIAFRDITEAHLFRVNSNKLKKSIGIIDGICISFGDNRIFIVKDAMREEDFDLLCDAISEKCAGRFDRSVVVERAKGQV